MNVDQDNNQIADQQNLNQSITNDEISITGKGYYQQDILSTKNVNEQLNKNKMDIERVSQNQIKINYDERPLAASKNNNQNALGQYDELPVGKSKDKIIMEEFPPGFNPIPEGQIEEEDKDKGPLSVRLQSKLWKTRQKAFEDLQELFKSKDKSDTEFNQYCEEFLKFISDANLGAQEKALKAIEVWFSKTKSCGSSLDINELIKCIIEKCLTGKPSLKPSSIEIICILFENGGKDQIFETILSSFQNKNQKVVCAAIILVSDLLMNYGVKKMNFLKPFLPEIEKLVTNSTSAAIKKECTNFYHEAYKWLGASLVSLMQNMKKQYLDELQKFFSEWQQKPMQPLRTDSQQQQNEGGSFDINGKRKPGDDNSLMTVIDPWDLAEPEDIFHKFNETWTERVFGLGKWNEKKEELDQFIKAASAIRLAPTNFQPCVSLIKKLINDANVNIVICALKMAGHLANGLRKPFYMQSKVLFGSLALKLRDIKKNVVDEANKSLQIFLQHCLTVEDVQEDLKETLQDKSAGAKQSCLQLLEKHAAAIFPLIQQANNNNNNKANSNNNNNLSSSNNNNKNGFKALLPVLKKLIEDGNEDVRNKTINLLARIKCAYGEEFFGNLLMDVSRVRMQKLEQKVTELSGTGNNNNSNNSEGMEEQTPRSDKSFDSIKKGPNSNQTGAAVNRQLNFRQLSPISKVPITTSNNNNNASKNAKSSSNAIAGKNAQHQTNVNNNNNSGSKPKLTVQSSAMEQDYDDDLNLENANSALVDECRKQLIDLNLVDSTVLEKLELSKSWKDKGEGLQTFDYTKFFANFNSANTLELLLTLLRYSFKDWKESNAMLLKELFGLLNKILDQVIDLSQNQQQYNQLISKKTLNLIMIFIAERLSEQKFCEPNTEIVRKLCKLVMPQQVTLCLIFQTLKNKLGSIANNNNTKQLTEMCNLIYKQIEMYTLTYQPFKECLSLAKNCIISTFANVKAAALTLLKILYQHKGKEIIIQIQDLPPQQLKTIQPELEKMACLTEKEKEARIANLQTQRLLPPSQVLDEYQMQIQNKEKTKINNMPRVDITNEVNKIQKKLTDGNWKIRKEGLDGLEQIIRGTAGRINPQGLQELFSSLKLRLNDVNKALSRQCMQNLSRLVESIGSGVRIYGKLILPPLIGNLQDKERFIRQETLSCLDAWASSIGPEQVLNHCPPYLCQESPELKHELLQWITKYLDSLEKCEIKLFIQPILHCLSGKQKDIRAISEQILEKMISFMTIQPFYAEMKDMKPAVVQQLRVILEKYQGQMGNSQGDSGNKMQIESHPIKGKVNNIIDEQIQQQQSEQLIQQKVNNQCISNSNFQQQQQQQLQFQQINTRPNIQQQQQQNYQNSIQQLSHAQQKELRLKCEIQKPWPLDSLDDDLVELLSQNFRNVGFPEDLCRKLFSYDFYKNIEAAQYITENLEQAQDISDLFLKWAFLRTWGNGNALLAESVLAMLGKVISCLISEKYFLLEFEIQIFLSIIKNYIFMHEGRERRETLHCLLEKAKQVIEQTKIIRFWIDCLEANAMINSSTAENCIYNFIENIFVQSLPNNELGRLAKITSIYEQTNLIQTLKRFYGEQQLKSIGFNPLKLNKPLQLQAQFQQQNLQQQQIQAGQQQNTQYQPQQYQQQQQQQISNNLNSTNVIQAVSLQQQQVQVAPQNSLNFTGIVQPQKQQQPQITINNKLPQTTTSNPLQVNTVNTINTITPQPITEALTQAQYLNLVQKSIEIINSPNSSLEDSTRSLKELQALITSEQTENLLSCSSYILEQMSFGIVQQFRDRRARKAQLVFQQQQQVSQVSALTQKAISNDYMLLFLQTMGRIMQFDCTVQKLEDTVLYQLTEATYTQLLYEGENREDPKSVEPITKQLNSNMLRLLETANINAMLNTLFDLLIKMRRQVEYSKHMGILIKCILKLVRTLNQNIQKIDVGNLLLHFHEYIQEFQNKVDDVGMRTIKTIVQEIVNALGEVKIQEIYKVVQNHEKKDFYINYWIQTYLKSPNQNQASPHQQQLQVNSNSNNNDIANNNKNSPLSNLDQRRNAHIRTVNQNLDIIMKQIVEALEKNDQDENALMQLKDICQKNSNFNWSSHFNQNNRQLIENLELKLKEILQIQEQCRISNNLR